MVRFSFLFLFLLSSFRFVHANENAGARHPAWLALLHYQRTALGLYRSGIDSKEFFLSEKGKSSPEHELKATMEALLDPDRFEEVACRYPARTKWLRNEMKLALPDDPSCDRFEEWRRKLAPKGVSLVFASYYFNNPASMYGHTFLKLHREGYQLTSGLLDYTVNYAAATDSTNGVLFAIRGLTGLYQGRFSTDPYYFKIQKYNNMESRDLWEYHLNLTEDEMDTLVRHMWELGSVWSRYYFFNRNCSYQLLPLIDVVRPHLQLSKPFRFRAVPLDTLKAVVRAPGLLHSTSFRPSRVKIMAARAEQMSMDEIKLARHLSKEPSDENKEAFKAIPDNRQAFVLDLALDFWRGQAGFLRDMPEEDRATERALLLMRRDVQQSGGDVSLPEERPPHESHGVLQFAGAFGADKREPFWELKARPALHDLNSDPRGYIEGSQLEMLNLTFRHRYREGQFFVKDFTLIRILSLTPWHRIRRSPSWAVHAGFETPDDVNSDRRLSGVLGGGSGLTVRAPVFDGVYLFVLGKGEAAQGPMYRDGYRLGFGGESGMWILFGTHARLLLKGSAFRFGAGHPGNRVELSATQTFNLNQNIEIRVEGSRKNQHAEGKISLVLNLDS